jgi:hypothetical protein
MKKNNKYARRLLPVKLPFFFRFRIKVPVSTLFLSHVHETTDIIQ